MTSQFQQIILIWPQRQHWAVTDLHHNHKEQKAGNLTKRKCYISDIKNKKLKKRELKGKWQSGKYTKFMPGKKGYNLSNLALKKNKKNNPEEKWE